MSGRQKDMGLAEALVWGLGLLLLVIGLPAAILVAVLLILPPNVSSPAIAGLLIVVLAGWFLGRRIRRPQR